MATTTTGPLPSQAFLDSLTQSRTHPFVAYARYHGRSVRAQLEHDGMMDGNPLAAFRRWFRQQREAFLAAHGTPGTRAPTAQLFARWLDAVADRACWARAIAPLVPDIPQPQDPT